MISQYSLAFGLFSVALVAMPVVAEEERPEAARPEAVSLSTEDDRSVEATLFPSAVKSPPALILVPDWESDRSDWDRFAQEIANRGVAVLTLSLDRAVEADGAERLEFHARDVRAAVRFVREREEIDGVRVALLGASRGANVAAHYATDDQLLIGLGLVSPEASVGERSCAESVSDYGMRELLLADAKSAGAQAVIDEVGRSAKGSVKQLKGDGKARGVRMLDQFMVRASILEWLDGVFQEI